MGEWRIRLVSPPESVYELLATAEGRAAFWAEAAPELEGMIEFSFPSGRRWRGRILAAEPPRRFSVDYFGSQVVFELEDDGRGGCDLRLTDPDDDPETRAAWVSVLLALKAAADFGIDLRNHDAARTWDEGFADN